MFLATAPLPDDPIALRVFAQSLQAAMAREVSARDAEIYEKALHIEKLKAQLAELRRARFGRSSEQIARDVEQLELALEDLEKDQARRGQSASEPRTAGVNSDTGTTARETANRKPLPEHLPRERVAA